MDIGDGALWSPAPEVTPQIPPEQSQLCPSLLSVRSVCRAQQSHYSPAQPGNCSSAPTHSADLIQHPKVFFTQWKRWSGSRVITAMVTPMEMFAFCCLLHTLFLCVPLQTSRYLLCPVSIHFHTHWESRWLLQEIKVFLWTVLLTRFSQSYFGLFSLASGCFLCNGVERIWGNGMGCHEAATAESLSKSMFSVFAWEKLSWDCHSRITFQIHVFSLRMGEGCEQTSQ